jgi:hypothetical protein
MLKVTPIKGSNITGLKEFTFMLGMNGAADPTLLKGAGLGSLTGSRTGVGVWAIPLADAPDGEFKGAHVSMSMNGAPVDLKVQFKGFNSSTNVFTLSFSTGANAAADVPAANANSWVKVTLHFGSPVSA